MTMPRRFKFYGRVHITPTGIKPYNFLCHLLQPLLGIRAGGGGGGGLHRGAGGPQLEH